MPSSIHISVTAKGDMNGLLGCERPRSATSLSRGPKHQPTGGELFRAGNSSGRVLVDGEGEEVLRPRVRKRQQNGSTSEVTLASYASASNPEELQASIVLALMAGVSTREITDVKPRSPGVGKSNVSRLWQSVGHKFVDQLRGESLADQDWVAVKLPPIRLISTRSSLRFRLVHKPSACEAGCICGKGGDKS